MTFELTKNDTKIPVQGQDNRHLKFACLIARGVKPAKAKIKAGFSPDYKTKQLLDAAQTIKATKTVQEAREVLQQTPGRTIYDCVDVAQEIRDDKKNSHPDTMLRANRQIIEVLGYNAPELINIEERSLSINLSNMSIEELANFIKDSTPT